MKPIAFIAFCLSIGPIELVAQDMSDRVRAAIDTTSGVQDRVDQSSAEQVVPSFDEELPYEAIPSVTVLEYDGVLHALGDSEEAERFNLFGENISAWGVSSVPDGALDAANAAVSDPSAYIEPNFFTSTNENGQICTVDSFEAAPAFTRSCDRSNTITSARCVETPSVSAHVVEKFECSTTAVGAIACSNLTAFAQCIEDVSMPCLVPDIGAPDGCSPVWKAYVCSGEVAVPVANTRLEPAVWHVEIAEPLRICDPVVGSGTCSFVGTSCPAGPTVIFAGSEAIPFACGETIEDYACTSPDFQSDCAAFEDGKCTLTSSSCILTDDYGTCLNFEDTYECGGGDETPAGSECEAVTVCVGDVCQTVESDPSDDFLGAMSRVAMVNEIVVNNADELGLLDYFFFDEESIQIFTGDQSECARAIFSTYNCCRETGWALGVFTDCSEEEIQLNAAVDADRVVYLSTYCSKKFFVCTEKKRRYCVYGSKLARIVSQAVIAYLGEPYACRGLTYQELKSVDFAALDLSGIYGDLAGDATLPNSADLVEALADNILATQPILEETYE